MTHSPLAQLPVTFRPPSIQLLYNNLSSHVLAGTQPSFGHWRVSLAFQPTSSQLLSNFYAPIFMLLPRVLTVMNALADAACWKGCCESSASQSGADSCREFWWLPEDSVRRPAWDAWQRLWCMGRVGTDVVHVLHESGCGAWQLLFEWQCLFQ